MPYVDLYSDSDYASIFYATNTDFGNVGGFDPEKPTILMLHPTFLDSSWLSNQFGDPRLDRNYNLIAFDMRVSGRSTCKPSGMHDSWVDAADLAYCHQLIAYWEVAMPPRKRRRMVELMNIVMNVRLLCVLIIQSRPQRTYYLKRTPLKSEIVKEIKQPVLIIHGDRNETCPQKYAERLQSELSNAESAYLYSVKGGAGGLNVVPGTASITNQVYTKFLARLPRAKSDVRKRSQPIEDRMTTALERLAELVGDSSIASRPPCSLSFSCLPNEVVRGQTESLDLYKKGESEAFDPTGPDGRPIRKYSEKKDEHWFHGERNGISYAKASFIKKQDGAREERQLPPVSPSEPPTNGDHSPQGRLRRATVGPASISEKTAIKGSMAKVVGSNSTTTFQRLLK
ncbi:hypothetical protein V5O48_000820 [Marasmius crinis-equi]|uniref:Alpha/beta-hydrolase n=1 Tax=Marasmius crinis-equi TaxID=585013 RepID=A0ABR3G0B9_9AGAR